MTKGELLVSIIKSLGYNGEVHLDPNNISLQDDYFEVTANVCEIINRALTRLYECNKLPKKSFYIYSSTPTINVGDIKLSNYARYNLNTLIDDFGKINEVTLENGINTTNATLKYEGEYIVLEKINENMASYARYVLIYTPAVQRVHDYDPDTMSLPYKDEIYEKVVYYAKAELLEETNVSLAIHYRNLFEQCVEDSNDEAPEVIRKVKDVYGMFG